MKVKFRVQNAFGYVNVASVKDLYDFSFRERNFCFYDEYKFAKRMKRHSLEPIIGGDV